MVSLTDDSNLYTSSSFSHSKGKKESRVTSDKCSIGWVQQGLFGNTEHQMFFSHHLQIRLLFARTRPNVDHLSLFILNHLIMKPWCLKECLALSFSLSCPRQWKTHSKRMIHGLKNHCESCQRARSFKRMKRMLSTSKRLKFLLCRIKYKMTRLPVKV